MSNNVLSRFCFGCFGSDSRLDFRFQDMDFFDDDDPEEYSDEEASDDDDSNFSDDLHRHDYESSVDEDRKSEPGKVVERFNFHKDITEAGAEDVERIVRSSLDEDLWSSMPDEVMRLIVYRLPFSAFCSFKCVCKEWKALVVHPDATLITTRSSPEVPLCVVCVGPDQFISYNPCLHSWCIPPATFGSSFGALGFSRLQKRVVAGRGGLLVLESADSGLWVMNPVNKSERRLPFGGFNGGIRKVHIQLNADASYRVVVVIDVDAQRVVGETELHVYDSKTNSWGKILNDNIPYSYSPTSVVEYAGDLFFLRQHESGIMYPSVYRLRLYPVTPDGSVDVNFRVREAYDLPSLPVDLLAGHLFVQQETLMLGGVRGMTRMPSFAVARIWQLSRKKKKWLDIAHVNLHALGLDSLRFEVLGSVRGDFLWIADAEFRSSGRIGVMCHIPSNSWWKVPNSLDSVDNREQELDSVDDYGFPMSFLFEPRMDLVA